MPNEVSLAIGKGGLNIRLASQLTGYEIDVYREGVQDDEEDVNLEEFADEIDGWIIDELKKDVPIWKKEHWADGAEWKSEL